MPNAIFIGVILLSVILLNLLMLNVIFLSIIPSIVHLQNTIFHNVISVCVNLLNVIPPSVALMKVTAPQQKPNKNIFFLLVLPLLFLNPIIHQYFSFSVTKAIKLFYGPN
jgi:hypothetical protein